MGFVKRNFSTIAIAFAVSTVAAASPVIAHGVQHALFAHEAGVARNAEKLDGSDSSAFVRNSGEILVTMPPTEWIPPGTVTLVQRNYSNVVYEKSMGGAADFKAMPSLPETMYGKRLRLEGVELCVDASEDGVEYTYVEVQTYKNEDDSFFTGPVAEGHGETFEDNEQGCHLYPFDPPVLLGPGRINGVFLNVGATWNAPGTDFALGRATLILEPTNRTAPELVGS